MQNMAKGQPDQMDFDNKHEVQVIPENEAGPRDLDDSSSIGDDHQFTEEHDHGHEKNEIV